MRLRGSGDPPGPPEPAGGAGFWLSRQLDILRTDLTQAFRSLRTSPVTTVATILMLAVAIGLTTLTFGVVYATTIRDLPYEHVDRLVEIDHWGERVDGRFGHSVDTDNCTTPVALTADAVTMSSSSDTPCSSRRGAAPAWISYKSRKEIRCPPISCTVRVSRTMCRSNTPDFKRSV